MKLFNRNKINEKYRWCYIYSHLLFDITQNKNPISICKFCGMIYMYDKSENCEICHNSDLITDMPSLIKSEIYDIFNRKGIRIINFTSSDFMSSESTFNFHLSKDDAKYLKSINILPENCRIVKTKLVFLTEDISYLSFVKVLKTIIEWSRFIPNDRINLQHRCAQCKFWKCLEYQNSGVKLEGYCKKHSKYARNIHSICKDFKK